MVVLEICWIGGFTRQLSGTPSWKLDLDGWTWSLQLGGVNLEPLKGTRRAGVRRWVAVHGQAGRATWNSRWRVGFHRTLLPTALHRHPLPAHVISAKTTEAKVT